MESETDWERVEAMTDDEVEFEISEEMKSLNKKAAELLAERNKRVRSLEWFYHAARKQAKPPISGEPCEVVCD